MSSNYLSKLRVSMCPHAHHVQTCYLMNWWFVLCKLSFKQHLWQGLIYSNRKEISMWRSFLFRHETEEVVWNKRTFMWLPKIYLILQLLTPTTHHNKRIHWWVGIDLNKYLLNKKSPLPCINCNALSSFDVKSQFRLLFFISDRTIQLLKNSHFLSNGWILHLWTKQCLNNSSILMANCCQIKYCLTFLKDNLIITSQPLKSFCTYQ